jgi:phospholipase/carboxylesterase
MKKILLGKLGAHLLGGSDGSGGGDGPLVILLHGFGAPGTDLTALAGEVDVPAQVRWLFPMAPLLLEPGAPETLAARAWWMIDMMELQVAAMTRQYAVLTERRPPGIDAAREQLESLLDAAMRELSVPPERILLGGFSQGAMLATDLVLRGSHPLAGLAVFSGTLINRSEWVELAPKRRGLPVLACHGRSDPILPFSLAEELRDLLVGAGLELDWVPFPGGHGIPAPALMRLGALLRRLWFTPES